MVPAWLKPEEVGKLFFFDTLMVDPRSKESGLLSNVSILLWNEDERFHHINEYNNAGCRFLALGL